MLIGLDATALYGRYGGVEYALWNLLDAMRAENTLHRFQVWIPRDGPPPRLLKRFPDSWLFERLPFDGAHKSRRIAWQQFELPAAIRRARCHLLHAPTYVCPLLAPVPVVLTVYDLIALSGEGNAKSFATRANRLHYGAMLPLSIRRAARVLVPSQPVRDDIIKRGLTSSKRVQVIAPGVEPLFFGPHAQSDIERTTRKFGLPENYILWAGNFEPKKNHALLQRAMELLKTQSPNDRPTLALAGGARAWRDWELPAVAADVARLDGPTVQSANVQHLGYVRRCELPLLLAGARAFAFPSFAEGFGMPALEALAAGAPLVASDRVPLPNLESVALICDPHNPKSLANQLSRVLNDADLARSLRTKGRAYARDFSWRRAAQDTLRVYEDVMGAE